jgi:hypothetical protein
MSGQAPAGCTDRLYTSGAGHYVQPTFGSGRAFRSPARLFQELTRQTAMRPEIEALAEAAKQSIGLLRRHL